MNNLIPAANAADISVAADTTNFTMEAPYAGKLAIDESFLRWTEETGTQTTTEGVVSIEVAGVEVATLTANVADAVGQTQRFEAADDKYIEFSEGDNIAIKTKTQATGGTVTGDGTVYLSLNFGV